MKIGPVDAEIYSVDLKKKKFRKVKYMPGRQVCRAG